METDWTSRTRLNQNLARLKALRGRLGRSIIWTGTEAAAQITQIRLR